MPRPNQKDAILEAAQAIVLESGAVHMTLDAVADRCKISKGGLIYNYPTKEMLLEAMVVRLTERHEELRKKIREEIPEDEPNELLVEIRLFMEMTKADHRLGAALLAALANKPDMTDKFRGKGCERFNKEIAVPEEFERSSILFFAAFGLHFQRLLHMRIVNEDQEKRIFSELLRLAKGKESI